MENNKKYAIKIMKEENINTEKKLDNFINEVKILSEMNHENIVNILYVNLNGEYRKCSGKSYKVMYYVMKIAEYGEFYKILEHTPKLPEKLARYFFR
jgi:serine/threonine protein kinase